MGLRKYYIDIDGTLCNKTYGKYQEAIPYKDRIVHINKLYDEGNYIILWTARGKTTGIDWIEFTEKQMKEWGIRYNELSFNKEEVKAIVDDKAILPEDFFK